MNGLRLVLEKSGRPYAVLAGAGETGARNTNLEIGLNIAVFQSLSFIP